MHKGIHSQKFVEKRRKKRQILLFLFTLCILTVTASLIFILRSSFLQIKTIVVEGSVLTPQNEVAAAALSSLSGSYFNIVPHSSSFFYSKNNIEEAVEKNFKQIHSLKIHRKGLSGLRLSVQERAAAAVVCAGFRDEDEEGECYWSDSRGYIFGAVAASSTSPDLSHYYLPTEQSSITPGTNFIPEKRFIELQTFMSGAFKGGLVPLGLLVGENGEYEMYVKNDKVDSEITIYFDDRSSFDKTLENLLAFWQNSVQNKKTITTPAFDYINLRFGNTVYYSSH